MAATTKVMAMAIRVRLQDGDSRRSFPLFSMARLVSRDEKGMSYLRLAANCVHQEPFKSQLHTAEVSSAESDDVIPENSSTQLLSSDYFCFQLSPVSIPIYYFLCHYYAPLNLNDL